MDTDEKWHTYLIYGRHYNRIEYGKESNIDHSRKKCDGCQKDKGHLHVLGCGIEQCPACGQVAVICTCEAFEDE